MLKELKTLNLTVHIISINFSKSFNFIAQNLKKNVISLSVFEHHHLLNYNFINSETYNK